MGECAQVGANTVDEAARMFMSHPVGLMNGDEPYVRSPQAFDGDAMKFYCAVTADVELEVLQSTDIVSDTAAALANANGDGKVAVPASRKEALGWRRGRDSHPRPKAP